MCALRYGHKIGPKLHTLSSTTVYAFSLLYILHVGFNPTFNNTKRRPVYQYVANACLVTCPFQPVHLYCPSLDIIKGLLQVLQATTSTWSVKMVEQWANRILFLLLNFQILKLKVCVGQVFDVQTTQMFGLDVQRSCTQDRHQFEGMPNHPNQQSSLVRPPPTQPLCIKSFLVIHFFGTNQ